jgi:hypothetical protein
VPRVRDDEYDVLVDGEEVFELPLTEFDGEWFRFQNLLRLDPDPADLQAAGIGVRRIDTPRPPRCADLLERLGG